MMRLTRQLLVVSQEQMHARLSTFFTAPSVVEVIDSSGGCGASFNCRVESPLFVGKTLPNQHKMVVSCLKGNTTDANFPPCEAPEKHTLENLFVNEQGEEQFHALTIKTRKME